jgi:hypothetical protein
MPSRRRRVDLSLSIEQGAGRADAAARVSRRSSAGRVGAAASVRPRGSLPRVLAGTAVLATTSLFCAAAGFYRMFTLFAAYDDEGYVLVLLREVAAGRPLYDGVYSQYGPFFVGVMSTFFRATGLSIDHDHGRLLSLAMWLVTSLCLGVWAAVVAGSALAGGVVQLLVFRVLWLDIGYEPMHPAGLVCALLATLVGTTALEPRYPRFAAALQGALLAALSLVKINIGGLAALAVLLRSAPDLVRQGRRTSAFLVVAAAVAAPTLLTGQSLGAAWAQSYDVLATAAVLGVALVNVRGPARVVAPIALGWLLGGAGLTAALIVADTLLRGSTLTAVVRGVAIAPLHHAAAFTLPLEPPGGVVLLALAALAACVVSLAARPRLAARPDEPWSRIAASAGRLAAGSALLATSLGIALPAGWSGGFWLAPLVWVAAWPPGADPPKLGAARRLLAPLAALQILQAYPVAGTQVAWGSFLMVPAALLCLRDAAVGLTAARRLPAGAWGVRFASTAALLALSLSVASFFPRLVSLRAAYASRKSLALPGAQLIHLPPQKATQLRRLVRAIDANCKTFVGLPGLNSLYLWARYRPPTGFNHNAWMFTFDEREQSEIVQALTSIEGPCVIRNEKLLDFWRAKRDLPEGPLVRYIENEFVPVARFGSYEILLPTSRRDKAFLDPRPSPANAASRRIRSGSTSALSLRPLRPGVRLDVDIPPIGPVPVAVRPAARLEHERPLTRQARCEVRGLHAAVLDTRNRIETAIEERCAVSRLALGRHAEANAVGGAPVAPRTRSDAEAEVQSRSGGNW